jgi:hypothetical protein
MRLGPGADGESGHLLLQLASRMSVLHAPPFLARDGLRVRLGMSNCYECMSLASLKPSLTRKLALCATCSSDRPPSTAVEAQACPSACAWPRHLSLFWSLLARVLLCYTDQARYMNTQTRGALLPALTCSKYAWDVQPLNPI